MLKAFGALSLVVVAGLFAAGSGAVAEGFPAIVDHDGSCNLLGANDDGSSFCCTAGEVTVRVENGNRVTLKCQDDDGVNNSGRGQSYRDFACSISYSGGNVIVTDTHAAVSANGNSSLDCTYEK